jgi:hypothetical protein
VRQLATQLIPSYELCKERPEKTKEFEPRERERERKLSHLVSQHAAVPLVLSRSGEIEREGERGREREPWLDRVDTSLPPFMGCRVTFPYPRPLRRVSRVILGSVGALVRCKATATRDSLPPEASPPSPASSRD